MNSKMLRTGAWARFDRETREVLHLSTSRRESREFGRMNPNENMSRPVRVNVSLKIAG